MKTLSPVEIKALCKVYNITQTDLAINVNISRSALTLQLNELRTYRLDIFEKVTVFLQKIADDDIRTFPKSNNRRAIKNKTTRRSMESENFFFEEGFI